VLAIKGADNLKSSIDFRILNLEKTIKLGYLGGLKIGTKFIFMLEHRRFENGKLVRVQSPSFLTFKGSRGHKDRGQGTPMSKKEFDTLLELFLTNKQIREINRALYQPVREIIPHKNQSKK